MALEDGFHLLDLATGATRRLAEVQHKAPSMRMNDGRTDRQGRFVAGSMVLGRHDRDGAFYRLEKEGSATRLFDGIALANTTCFSPDGRTLYYADSFSDLPMLSMVGRPCAVNPDSKLRAAARDFDWPVLDLR